jgi:microcystin-dependent protein
MPATQVAIGLNKQDYGDGDWHTPLNAGIDEANTRLTLNGTTSPAGVVTGRWKGQRYFQSDVVAWWVFNGTVGTTTGWVREIPQGVIQMWSGAIGSIPSGWTLCDGVAVGGYTPPNLKGRFIVGYDPGDADYNTIGDTGGEKAHALTVAELAAHDHGGVTGSGGASSIAQIRDANGTSNDNVRGGDIGATLLDSIQTNNHTHTIPSAGSGTAHENRPPFYTLAYIAKL